MAAHLDTLRLLLVEAALRRVGDKDDGVEGPDDAVRQAASSTSVTLIEDNWQRPTLGVKLSLSPLVSSELLRLAWDSVHSSTALERSHDLSRAPPLPPRPFACALSLQK